MTISGVTKLKHTGAQLHHSKKRLCCFDPKLVVLGTVEMCRDTSVSWLRILAFP